MPDDGHKRGFIRAGRDIVGLGEISLLIVRRNSVIWLSLVVAVLSGVGPSFVRSAPTAVPVICTAVGSHHAGIKKQGYPGAPVPAESQTDHCPYCTRIGCSPAALPPSNAAARFTGLTAEERLYPRPTDTVPNYGLTLLAPDTRAPPLLS